MDLEELSVSGCGWSNIVSVSRLVWPLIRFGLTLVVLTLFGFI